MPWHEERCSRLVGWPPEGLERGDLCDGEKEVPRLEGPDPRLRGGEQHPEKERAEPCADVADEHRPPAIPSIDERPRDRREKHAGERVAKGHERELGDRSCHLIDM